MTPIAGKRILQGIFVSTTFVSAAFAQSTDTDLDSQVQHYEKLKKIAEAKASIADYEAKAAQAQAKSQTELEEALTKLDKAKIDRDQTEINAIKSTFPTPIDPSKYAVKETVSIPMEVIADDTVHHLLKTRIAPEIVVGMRTVLQKQQCPATETATIILDSGRARPAISTYQATDSALRQYQQTLNNVFPPAGQPRAFVSPGIGLALSAISSIGETALSFAAALRPKRLTADVTNEDAKIILPTLVLQSLSSGDAINTLSADGKTKVGDPSKPIDVFDVSYDLSLGDLSGTRNQMAADLVKLRDDIRIRIADATKSIATLRGGLGKKPSVKDPAKPTAAEKESVAKWEEANKDIVSKEAILEAIVTAMNKLHLEQDGVVPFIVAQLGARTAGIMQGNCSYIGLINPYRSRVKTYTKDGLLSGFKGFMDVSLQAEWKLYRPSGQFIGGGTAATRSKWIEDDLK